MFHEGTSMYVKLKSAIFFFLRVYMNVSIIRSMYEY